MVRSTHLSRNFWSNKLYYYCLLLIVEYGDDDTGKFKTIVAFDCRGVEPIEFSPRAGWIVKATDGGTFNDVDLSEDDWADYDEKSGNSVGISEFKSQFVKLKK